MKNIGGRPKTRERESLMIHVWWTVRREVELGGAKSVRAACAQIFKRINGNKMIKVRDEVLGGKISPITEHTLRSRYYVAERARHDAQAFPSLHAICAQRLAQVPELRRNKELLRKELAKEFP